MGLLNFQCSIGQPIPLKKLQETGEIIMQEIRGSNGSSKPHNEILSILMQARQENKISWE